MDIRIIIKEFSKKEPDYERLDRIIKDLKFFVTLNKPIRIKLLQCSSYTTYQAGETVFKQGDFGDMVYVILRGAVNVKVSRVTPYGTTEEITLGTLYDGNQFGEYSMMGTATQKNQIIPMKNV